MRRLPNLRTVIAGLAIVVAAAARPAPAADKAPNDRLLPQRTYFYATIPNVRELKSRFGQTLTGRLLQDPKLADFLGDVKKKIAEFGDEFQKVVGLKLDDVLAIPDGEMSVAVLLPTDAKTLAVAGILDFGKSGAAVNTLLEKASAALEKSGFKKSTRELEGAQLTVYDKKKEGEAGSSEKSAEPSFGSQFAYVIKGDTLVVTTGVLAMQDVLRRWDGKHAETLADVPAYKSIIDVSKQGNSPAVAIWYINPITLVQALFKAVETVDPGIGIALNVLPMLGVNNLKAVGGSLHMVTDDYDTELRTLICVDQPVTGLLSVLQFPPTNEAPPKWVTDDASSYVAINWDVAKAYSAIEQLVDGFTSPGWTAQKIDDLANDENGPKIHAKKDVIDNLDGKIHIVTDVPDPNKADSTRLLVAIGVKDAKKMKGVLEKVSKMPGFPGQPREFRGETIYNLEAIPGFGDSNRTMGVALVNDNVVFSNDVGRIEQMIIADKDRKPLAESPKYKRFAKYFPAKTSILWYQEQDAQMKSVYEMLRSGKASEAIAATPFAKIIEGIDFKKLPDFEVIQKYLPASGLYAVPHPAGALIESFSLKGPSK